MSDAATGRVRLLNDWLRDAKLSDGESRISASVVHVGGHGQLVVVDVDKLGALRSRPTPECLERLHVETKAVSELLGLPALVVVVHTAVPGEALTSGTALMMVSSLEAAQRLDRSFLAGYGKLSISIEFGILLEACVGKIVSALIVGGHSSSIEELVEAAKAVCVG